MVAWRSFIAARLYAQKEVRNAGQERRTIVRDALTLLGLVLLLAPSGCAFGPQALEGSHGRYNEAIRTVNEEQLLRNLVHLRYTESPLNLEVSVIANQYELSGQAEGRPFFSPQASDSIFRSFSTVLPDILVSAANRPTFTLNPADDANAVRQFFTPIKADTLAFLAQTSWPTSTILRLWVREINGVPNAAPASGPPPGLPPDFARFQRLVELLQIAQDRQVAFLRAEEQANELSSRLPAEAVTATAAVEAAKNALEYQPRDDGKKWVLVRKERRLVLEVNPGAEGSPELAELAALLNLTPGRRRYEVVVQPGRLPDPARIPVEPSTVFRIVPRSTAEVWLYLANGVEVPAEHLSCGLVAPIVDAEGRVFDSREVTRDLLEVHACKGHKPPACAYVAVRYRGYWYYIDDRDLASKATFLFTLELSRLDFKQQLFGSQPILNIPVAK
jgi:hypothetical protein